LSLSLLHHESDESGRMREEEEEEAWIWRRMGAE
jgi:hypothetical protein